MNLKPHPFAEVFPMMPEDELKALAESIKTGGLRERVTLYQGMILDGRNRFSACRLAGIEATTKDFKGNDDDAKRYVLQANVERRHLTSAQKALAVTQLATMSVGKPPKVIVAEATILPTLGTTQSEVADMVGVSRQSISEAKAILETAPASVTERVRSGELSLKGALREINERDEHKPKPSENADSDPTDEYTPGVRECFAEAWRLDEILKLLGTAKRKLEDWSKLPVFAFVRAQNVGIDIGNAMVAVRHAKPFAPCCYCKMTLKVKDENGKRTDCAACRGVGWLPKDIHKAAPSELRGDE